ncbi:uncharacterized protein UV8b_02938 [Ustilaginoidea virens]|uniref:Uncharacterized protein n=1 Tax=Ustilaginoidea virens TaxID=1159556 RepID=A0A8E5MGM3_USTVR|nr:uncharacterized protein UV8b_02938 [Ustilaginoidea virens]QUC18697.1 hypothetical protein UV8b_02938 [Ustilaginoidea virens]
MTPWYKPTATTRHRQEALQLPWMTSRRPFNLRNKQACRGAITLDGAFRNAPEDARLVTAQLLGPRPSALDQVADDRDAAGSDIGRQ